MNTFKLLLIDVIGGTKLRLSIVLVLLLFVGLNHEVSASPQFSLSDFGRDTVDNRAQLPLAVQKSYFEFSIGSVGYPFGANQLQPGYSLASVKIHRPAVRLVLLGYEFNKYLSAQVTYMRPIWWVNYKYRVDNDVSGTVHSRTVWMNVAGATLRPSVPLSKKVSIYAEGGLGLVTRHGIKDKQENVVISDLNFATTTFGAGVTYNLNETWALQAVGSYTAAVKKNDQPYISFVGVGFKYGFTPFSNATLKKATKRGLIHPKQWFHLSYSTNAMGYGVNRFFQNLYLFWGGAAEIDKGFMVTYQRNLFHGPKVFALDIGVNAAYWNTNGNDENFFALSVYPVIRLNYLHNKYCDPYFFYILGGPTYLSKYIIDGHDTGKHFTFYDAIGTGAFFGKRREFNAELKIAHYSNGNLFPMNTGVKIPLTLSLGYSF